MAYKVFIDGRAGTTGLRIAGRLAERADIELLEIPDAERKDLNARLDLAKKADITILCLPDEEAREIVAHADPEVRLIDCSTAHRTADGWVYGMPEIVDVKKGEVRIANPGCHATGFILAVRPLVGIVLDGDAQLCCFSITGYSGGGKAMIAEYEAADRSRGDALSAPRRYALSQEHKHIPEMQKYAGLGIAPVFSPVVCDYYSGMLVCVALPRGAFRKTVSVNEVYELLAARYERCPLVKVCKPREEESGEVVVKDLDAAAFRDRDDIEIFVTGKDDRIEIVSRFDNLGKGASGAAIQNMNLVLGLPETAGLVTGK